jgi:uncharacterized protein
MSRLRSLTFVRMPRRPSAHDTTATLLTALGAAVRRVVITECVRSLFFSRIHAANSKDGRVVEVDARPSDAINFAVRHGAPIFVRNSVLDKYAK